MNANKEQATGRAAVKKAIREACLSILADKGVPASERLKAADLAWETIKPKKKTKPRGKPPQEKAGESKKRTLEDILRQVNAA